VLTGTDDFETGFGILLETGDINGDLIPDILVRSDAYSYIV